jgi:hypothetical protein
MADMSEGIARARGRVKSCTSCRQVKVSFHPRLAAAVRLMRPRSCDVMRWHNFLLLAQDASRMVWTAGSTRISSGLALEGTMPQAAAGANERRC